MPTLVRIDDSGRARNTSAWPVFCPQGGFFLSEFQTGHEPFFVVLGLQAEEVKPDFCQMRMPFRSELQQAGGLVHGGAIASLIDSAAVLAIKTGVDPSVTLFPTITMTVNYLAPAREIDLVAKARVIRRGRSIVFIDVDVASPSGDAVAKGQVVYKLPSSRKS
jgi:uncharacterized protein (TIGR00369 family)